MVDVNVRRVLGRYFGLAPNIEDKAFWRMAAGLVFPENPGEFNWALLDLGALVSAARDQGAGHAPLSGGCLSPERCL